jgi:regulator of protease activity HflC (stomatin/prohibitin superfamily)
MSAVNGKAPATSSHPSTGASTSNMNNSGAHDNSLVKVQPPRREDMQPSYAKQIQPDTEDESAHGWYGGFIGGLGSIIGTLGAIPCCIVCPNPYRSVRQGNVGLISKFGRFSRAVDPGLVKVNPLSERLIQIDVKIQIVEVPRQVCMTKDNVSLHLTSVIYYRVTSPHKVAFGISDVKQALVERTQTTLRHVLGARVLQDVIERREEIAASIREIIEETASGWGVDVESMLIKDIIFSEELQDSLSMAAQSKRTGEAKVIAARAEVESAKLMRQAADILSSAPAMQIRYLEAMQAMAKSANSKVIFLPGISGAMANLQATAAASSSEHDPSKGDALQSGGLFANLNTQQTGLNEAAAARVIENL